MSEDSAEKISTQQIRNARGRVSPLYIRDFEQKDRPDNPENLSPDQVQENCFKLLGYLEQYARTPGLDRPMPSAGK